VTAGADAGLQFEMSAAGRRWEASPLIASEPSLAVKPPHYVSQFIPGNRMEVHS
jgi:hypothetical protein